jgi:cytochrome P450
MRAAVRDIPLPGGAVIPAGCPMAVAFSSMAANEPAWRPDAGAFRPERFLAGGAGRAPGAGGRGPGPDALAPVPQSFNPFGVGTRYCMGSHLAHAEMAAVLFELARLVEAGYGLEADTPRHWAEFPILRPDNGLPARLLPRSGGGGDEDDDDYV